MTLRGSQVTSCLTFSSTMQSFYFIALALCSFSFLSPVLSTQCNETHYSWPVEQPEMCCDKCPPGKYMLRRPEKTCGIQCEACTGDRYTDTYNVQMTCDICEICNKQNMEYESHCTATHNAVCRCKAGFRCRDQQCTQCIPVPTTTTKPTLPPSATAFKTFTSTTPGTTTAPAIIKDTMWYLVIVALLCLGIVLFALTKLKPFLCWIRSKQGYLLAEKPTPLPVITTEDEGVSKPVQEMCGKCDQPIDV